MAVSSFAFQVYSSVHRPPPVSHTFDCHKSSSLSSNFKVPFLEEVKKLPVREDISQAIKATGIRILDAVVDTMFKFADQPLLPSQSNFGPVDQEIVDAVEVTCIEGKIPTDFAEGVYVRNGPNPLFGGLKTTYSIFGRSDHTWSEGEGMLHALHFDKKSNGEWTVSYSNRYVETQTFKLETRLNKPCFLPAIEGNSSAVLAAYFLNLLRFGEVNKHLSNTSVFEHSGKLYAIAENYLPQEIDISTLERLGEWNINGAWGPNFTSHPKKAPESNELVIFGISVKEPYYVVGVVSADGKELVHKAGIKFNKSILSHDIGVTQKYNIILDHPLTIDTARLYKGGSLLQFEKGGPARIGVMPRYGDGDSVKWFKIDSCCAFHLFNCFEDGEEVIVRGCKAPEAILGCPELGEHKFQWFSRGFKFQNNTTHSSSEYGYLFHSACEWRLNMVTGRVEEKTLSGINFSMDFPIVNGEFTGLKHKYGYTQVIDSNASSNAGIAKYGGLAKLYFDQPLMGSNNSEQQIKIEYHKFSEDVFCTGIAFVPKVEGAEEDDGWIITYVHNEKHNVSQVYIIDAKKFESEPTAIISLAQRVPYGFHGLFVSRKNHA